MTDGKAPIKFQGIFDGKQMKVDFRKVLAEMEKDHKKMFERVSKKSAKHMEDMIKRINTAVDKASGTGGAGGAKASTSSTDALSKSKLAAAEATRKNKEEHLAYMAALRQSRLEIQAHREAQAKANADLADGRITIQEYRKEITRLNLEEKKRRIAERAARKAANESSEYWQLNKQLGDLRQRSKDVLAEMFKLERQGRKNSVAYRELAKEAKGLVAQTNVLDRGIKKIDASLGLHQRNVGNYASALDAISPQFARINGQLAMMGVNLTEVAGRRNAFQMLGATITSVGKSVLAFLVSPIGLAITALGGLFMLFNRNKRTVVDFNNGLLNVAKTTGLAGAELEALSDSIIQLSRRLQTVGTDKLLEYATVAGQLGVKGAANIMAFTEALAKLETASNISGEEGGAEIARLLTLVDGGVQNVAAFGDEIVNLGNNFAATEKEILSNAEAISQNVGIYRMGRQDVLAYATATKSVGLEAEVVGSTFSRTLANFEKTLRTGKGVADLLLVIGGTQDELQARFRRDASGVFMDYIRGLNNIHKAGGSVNESLTKTGVVAVRDQRVIASLASNGYAVLEDAMIKVREAAGALDEEFRQKAASIENQTGRIKIAWDNLVLSIENGSGAIGQSAVVISGAFASILESITAVVSSSSWQEFFLRMGGGKSLFGWGMTTPAGNIMAGVAKTAAERNALRERDPWGYMLQEFREATKEVQEAELEAQREALAYFEANHVESEIDDVKRLRQHVVDLTKAFEEMHGAAAGDASAEPDGNAEELSKQQQRERDNAIRNQRQMQRQIDEMNESSLRSTLTRNEQEVESVKEKYRKIRQAIDDFRKDPKNKGMAVDASGLSAAQAREEAEVRYRQETAAMMKELGIQRQLWQDYEAWRLELGEESANERFSREMDLVTDFKQRLQQEIAEIGSMLTASLAGGADAPKLTGAEEDRLKQLQELLKQIDDQEQASRDARFRKAYQDYETYENQRLRIIRESEQSISALIEKGEHERADEAAKIRDRSLTDLSEAQIKSSKEFEVLFDDLEKMTTRQAKKAIADAKKFFDGFINNSKLSRREIEALQKVFDEFLKEAEKSADMKFADGFVAAAGEMERLVDMAMSFDGTMGKALKTMGDMVKTAASLATTIGKMMGDAGEGLMKTGGWGAIVGAALSVVGSVVQAIESADKKREKERDEAIKYSTDFQIKQMDAVTRMLEFQLSLIQDIYGIDRIMSYQKAASDAAKAFNDSFLEESEPDRGGATRTANVLTGKILLVGDKELDERIAKLNNRVATDARSAQQYAQARAKLIKDIADAGYSLERLDLTFRDITDIKPEDIYMMRQLVEAGRLDEVSEATVSNMLQQYDLWREATNQLNQELTGTTFQSITDEIVSMFREGKTAAKDFADSFEKLMQTSILNSFKRKYLEEALQGWYDAFADASESEGGLDEDEINKLRESYNSIIEEAKAGFEALKDVTKVSFGSSDSQGELSKGIAGITENTANRLEAEFGGLRLAQLQLLEVSKISANQALAVLNSQLAALNRISTFTGRTADNTDRLANIETAIVSLNNKITSTDALMRGAGLR